ncbi:MAG: ATP-binding cassette domain-containing protein [Gammaproteobacteria bacterium]|nr:ATP-binding cassette domain-containing protein [Gammaproteobacteria bacterium]NNJ73109.1 ATP-binding cassette domain-containing protein [Enterobacterales bacterium]
MSNNAIIQIEDMTYYRGSRAIFDGLSLTIEQGKTTAIMGPSGTGKTTLLKLIGGQLRPDSGRILFHGEDIHKLSTKELYSARRKMGMLFQSGALFSDLTVFENVAFPLREHTNLPRDIIRTVVLMKLQAVGLRGARELMPSELSGGMARRVALARAIALDPEMIMYDEPFAGQDPISMGVLMKLIASLNNALKLTSIVVSHDVTEVISISDYCYVLSGGRVMGSGTPEELFDDAPQEVSQFLKGSPDGPVKFHFPAMQYSDDLAGAAKR